jgi:predicted transcriptional regulator
MLETSFLFSEYRRRVLGLLLLHPDERYHVREIARLTNTTPGTLHRELSKLAKFKVLLRELSGNQVYYQANRHFPIYPELSSI